MSGRPMTLHVEGRTLEAAWWGPPPDAALDPGAAARGPGLRGAVAGPARSGWSSATGCGVFAYSRAGYGQSDPAPLPRPLSYMHDEARDVLPAVLDAARIRKAVLVGHSDGASIALLHAGGTQDFRIKGLVLIAPHVMVEDVSITSIEAARTAYETTDWRGRLAKYHRDVDNAFWGWNRAWLDPAFRAWCIDDSVPFVRVPILLIQGAEDEYGTAEQLRIIDNEAYCPVETVMVPGARHAPHITHLGEVIDAITTFTARVQALDRVAAPPTLTTPQPAV